MKENIKSLPLMIQNKKEDFEHNNKFFLKKKKKSLRPFLGYCHESKNLQLCDENKKL